MMRIPGSLTIVAVSIVVLSGCSTSPSASARIDQYPTAAVAPAATATTMAEPTLRPEPAVTPAPVALPTTAGKTGTPVAGAVATAIPAPAFALATAAPLSVTLGTATPGPQLTATLTSTVTLQGFGQNDFWVGFAFLVENPRADVAIEYSKYTVTAYTSEGLNVGTYYGGIELLLPGQELGVAGMIFLEAENQVVDRLDVDIQPGRILKLEEPGLSFDTVVEDFASEGGAVQVRGVVENPFDQDVAFLDLAAVAYDDSGAIIGGGSTYVESVPALGEAPAVVDIIASGEPARVELYASFSDLSASGGEGGLPCH